MTEDGSTDESKDGSLVMYRDMSCDLRTCPVITWEPLKALWVCITRNALKAPLLCIGTCPVITGGNPQRLSSYA